MNKEAVRKALLDAVDLADAVPDSYKGAAFQVAATALLDQANEEHDGEQRAAPRVATQPSESVNEILALLRERSHADRFQAIIFHALRGDGLESVTTDEILAAYSAARMAKPTNPSDIIAKCSRRGHVVEAPRRDGQKTWRLTGSGERYVENMLREQAA